jgi:hypothetical protein
MSDYINYNVKVYPDGTKCWYLNGKLHREDGPAVEWDNGNKWWFLNGKLHREDGPAIDWSDGTKKWCLNDKEYTEEEYLQEMQRRKSPPTCEGKVVEIEGKKYKLTLV